MELLLAALLCAQKVDPVKVEDAIDRGARYLIGQRGLPSLSHNMTTGLGYEELVLYTLVHAGVDRNDPQFQKLLQHAETAPLQRTYRVVLTALALEAIDAAKYQNRIADCAQFLADNLCENGQWGYGEETTLPKREPPKLDVASGGGTAKPRSGGTKALPRIRVRAQKEGPLTGDNSNTQYAALGIRACANAGIEFDAALLNKAAKWWMKAQGSDGSWGYSQSDAGYGSMTCGGIGALAIYRFLLRQDYKRDKDILAGVKWLSLNWKFDQNPKYMDTKRWLYYYIYAIERAGVLFGTETFGGHEWYPEGAKWLLKEQKENGSWVGPEGQTISDTCFAILFLRRATKPLQKVATGK